MHVMAINLGAIQTWPPPRDKKHFPCRDNETPVSQTSPLPPPHPLALLLVYINLPPVKRLLLCSRPSSHPSAHLHPTFYPPELLNHSAPWIWTLIWTWTSISRPRIICSKNKYLSLFSNRDAALIHSIDAPNIAPYCSHHHHKYFASRRPSQRD
jgi:hypothetical protein